MNVKDQKAGYRLIKVWVPNCDDGGERIDLDQWQPVRGLRFTGDDKAFFHGMSSLLSLNQRQKQQLLTMYATKYREALQRAGDSPSRHNKANQSANAWIRNGCRGFLIRD